LQDNEDEKTTEMRRHRERGMKREKIRGHPCQNTCPGTKEWVKK